MTFAEGGANKAMRIIHTGDLHLESKQETNLTKENAKTRRYELILTFKRMIEYAVLNDVEAILIAGDLFDSKYISRGTYSIVIDEIRKHDGIKFFYLKGNHDENDYFTRENIKNLFLFNSCWTTYDIANGITVTGREYTATESKEEVPSLNREYCNIVLLHGQITASGTSSDREQICLDFYRDKNIDYLALGHIHKHMEGRLDQRGEWVYPGCLEGRGFDECGVKGFELLDIDEESLKVNHTFIPFASRNLYEIEVDITGCNSSGEVEDRINQVLMDFEYTDNDLVRINLSGEQELMSEIDEGYLTRVFCDRFYHFSLVNHTKVRVNYEEFAKDMSLKGEFVRLVQNAGDISEDAKSRIIRKGISLILG